MPELKKNAEQSLSFDKGIESIEEWQRLEFGLQGWLRSRGVSDGVNKDQSRGDKDDCGESGALCWWCDAVKLYTEITKFNLILINKFYF